MIPIPFTEIFSSYYYSRLTKLFIHISNVIITVPVEHKSHIAVKQ